MCWRWFETKDLDLAPGQSRGTLPAAGHTMARGTQDGLDRVRVEPAGADLAPQLISGRGRGERLAVGARLAHCLVRVGRPQQPRTRRDRGALQPRG